MAVTTDKLSTVPKNGDAASLSPSWSGVRASSHGTGFSSGSSFGSITADRSGRVRCSTWHSSLMEVCALSYCCSIKTYTLVLSCTLGALG